MNRRSLIADLFDWWHGYSDADIESLAQKLHAPTYPWRIIQITDREAKALQHYEWRPAR